MKKMFLIVALTLVSAQLCANKVSLYNRSGKTLSQVDIYLTLNNEPKSFYNVRNGESVSRDIGSGRCSREIYWKIDGDDTWHGSPLNAPAGCLADVYYHVNQLDLLTIGKGW